MAGEWRRERFNKIAYLAREIVRPEDVNGLPYIALEHIGHGSLQLVGVGVAEDAISAKRRFTRGDILFGKLRPYFRKVVRAQFDGICSTDIWVIRPRNGVDARFLLYLMASDLFVEPVVRASEGTRMPRATWEYAASIELPLPPLPEQRAIAHILGTLDDKIELNRRMSETLEQMARALFKSWFVDFDPVRAKMDGRWKRPPLPSGEGRGEGGLPPGEGDTPPERKRKLPADILDFARQLRGSATDAERLLWRLLRNRGLDGAKFRRQHPFPPYVLDFYCPELRLAIELDGGQHNQADARRHDKQRTAELERQGVRVLRFWNREVLRETEAVLTAIYQAVVERREEFRQPLQPLQRPSPPAPLPEGEGGYLPAQLWDLFPDRLVDSELGPIPEGWEVKPLPALIEVNPARALRKGAVAPYLDMANMPTRGHSPTAVIQRPFGSGMRFANGDTLVARITPCLENGKTAFVDFLTDGQVGWGSTEYIVLRPKPALPVEFAYCLARSDGFREFAIQSMTGSSGRQRVPPESLSHFRLVDVPPQLAQLFGRLVQPLFARSGGATRESHMLATLRDALLPELISGNIRIKGGLT